MRVLSILSNGPVKLMELIKRKWKLMGFKESVSNRIEASYLCFDQNFDYFSGKWAWTPRVLPMMGYTGGGGVGGSARKGQLIRLQVYEKVEISLVALR